MTRRVAAVGAANLDVIGFPEKSLVGRDSNPGTIRLCAGGVSRNIAENLTRLGIDTELIAAVGDGPDGGFILESCRAVGIGISGIRAVPGRTSSMYMAVMDHQGDMALALSDMTIADFITPSHLEKCGPLLAAAEAVAADPCLSTAALEYLLDQAGSIPVFADPVSVGKAGRLRPLAGRIHTLKMNRLEAEAICGFPITDRTGLRKAGNWFLAAGTRQVFITLGGEELYWCGAEGNGTVPDEGFYRPAPVQVVNATGAGDAFTAGIMLAWLEGWDRLQAIRFSSAAAALALESEKTVNPRLTRAEVIRRMEENTREEQVSYPVR